ncbi:MAG: proteasome accessory factor PafA2, partial [Corynebacterium sp.]|nr:proteasome accessory factor PafA2 [Corynebacterium sp.]
ANWDTLILDAPGESVGATRVWLPDPATGTAEELEGALADVSDAAGLVRVIGETIPGSVACLD